MNGDIKELHPLDVDLYKCISKDIDTNRVVLTDKQIIHISERHPEAYEDVLIELNVAIAKPDYIIRDKKHSDTGLVIKEIPSDLESTEHSFIVLRICTDSKNGKLANSVISGWKIGDKRLQSYLRNNPILYKKE